MKRTTAAIVSAAIVIGFTQPAAHAQTGPYTSLSIGPGILGDIDIESGGEISTEVGPSISGTAGYQWWEWFRTEVEASWQRNQLDRAWVGGRNRAFDDGNLTTTGVFFNALVDFDDPRSPVIPYIGAGVGGVGILLNDPKIAGIEGREDEDLVFAWQAKAGFRIPMTRKADLKLEYAYQNMQDPGLNAADLDSYRTHGVRLGLHWNF